MLDSSTENARYAGEGVLITGGLGFIGSNLAVRLVADGATVTLIDSLIPEYGGNLHNIAGIETQCRVNISDVRDRYSMEHLVKGRDYLFNHAGQTGQPEATQGAFTVPAINLRAFCFSSEFLSRAVCTS